LMMPFYRVPDDGAIANEAAYAVRSAVDPKTPARAALEQGYIPTDDFYADHTPLRWRSRELFIPDLAVGRLVETPAEIETMVQAFLAYGLAKPTPAS